MQNMLKVFLHCEIGVHSKLSHTGKVIQIGPITMYEKYASNK
jgi:hypothetical protein